MKRTLSIFIIVLVAISTISYGQKVKGYLSEKKLKGSVKYIEEKTFYVLVGEGDDVEYNLKNHYLTKVNQEGNIEFNINRKDGESLIYEYNSKGENVEVSFNSAGEYTWRTIYSYDDNGNLIESNISSQDRGVEVKTIYQYDDNGDLIIEDMYDSEGYLEERIKRVYDANKNIISLITGNENKVNEINTYSYDEKGNPIEWTIIQDDELITNYTYIYDLKGNVIEGNSFYKDGTLREKFTYKYDYDQKGNWTKKITYNELSEQKIIEERKIVYYGDLDENDYSFWEELIKSDL